VRDGNEVPPAWSQEGRHPLISGTLPYGPVTLTGQSARCLADLGRTEHLNSSERYPELIKHDLRALPERIVTSVMMMQGDGDAFHFLSCLDEGDETRKPLTSSTFKDHRRLAARGCLLS
jgi:hypothetical protein